MTSPINPSTPPPDGPQKAPQPSSGPDPKETSHGNSFDSMLGKAKLSKKQREAFYNTLMQQAAATIKASFRHMIDTMKRNQRGE